jgi:hypothetical protein
VTMNDCAFRIDSRKLHLCAANVNSDRILHDGSPP